MKNQKQELKNKASEKEHYPVSVVWEDANKNRWGGMTTTFDFDEFRSKVIASGGKIIKWSVIGYL